MMNTKSKLTEDMINKLQHLKGKPKLKFYINISDYYDEKIYVGQSGYFQFDEDPFAEKARGIGFIHHEALLLI